MGRQAHINKNGNIQDQHNLVFELKKSPNKRVVNNPLATQHNPQDSASDGQPSSHRMVKQVNFAEPLDLQHPLPQ